MFRFKHMRFALHPLSFDTRNVIAFQGSLGQDDPAHEFWNGKCQTRHFTCLCEFIPNDVTPLPIPISVGEIEVIY